MKHIVKQNGVLAWELLSLPVSVQMHHATYRNSSGFSLSGLLATSMTVLFFLHHSNLQILKFLSLLPRFRKDRSHFKRGEVDRQRQC